VHGRVAEGEHAAQNRFLGVGDVRLGSDDLPELFGGLLPVFLDRRRRL
jgi:hypothetical protein